MLRVYQGYVLRPTLRKHFIRCSAGDLSTKRLLSRGADKLILSYEDELFRSGLRELEMFLLERDMEEENVI